MKTLEEINKMIDSRKEENVNLAFQCCEDQGLDFEGLESMWKYVPIIKWLSNYLDGYDDIKEGLVKAINLESLDLSMERLYSLPNSIGLLSNLKCLKLRNNNLTELPNSIGNLSNLTELYLDNNELFILPESIGKLTNLKIFSIHGNRLETLPKSIGKLKC